MVADTTVSVLDLHRLQWQIKGSQMPKNHSKVNFGPDLYLELINSPTEELPWMPESNMILDGGSKEIGTNRLESTI